MKASNKRKNMAFAFKEMKHTSNYKYSNDFTSVREGVKQGQALFSKYLPQECINLLKETGN